MKREYYKWFSPVLQKDMELLVFGHAGAAVLLFPTRTAHFYDYENWGIVEAIRDKIENGYLQLFCVDSIDTESFYAAIPPADKIKRHLQYEQYILEEVIPFIQQQNHSAYLISAGCSLGGYHAVNIAFRHPTYFNKVVGMSARYDLTLSTHAFPDLFNGYVDEEVYLNMPGMYIPNLTDPVILEQLRKLMINIVVGRQDPFYESNIHLSEALNNHSIPHHLYVWQEEAHRARYWKEMFRLYL